MSLFNVGSAKSGSRSEMPCRVADQVAELREKPSWNFDRIMDILPCLRISCNLADKAVPRIPCRPGTGKVAGRGNTRCDLTPQPPKSQGLCRGAYQGLLAVGFAGTRCSFAAADEAHCFLREEPCRVYPGLRRNLKSKTQPCGPAVREFTKVNFRVQLRTILSRNGPSSPLANTACHSSACLGDGNRSRCKACE